MKAALTTAKNQLGHLSQNARVNVADAGHAAIDTAEVILKARHDVLFAVIDNARLNSEHAVRSSRRILSAENWSEAASIGRSELRVSVRRNVSQASEIISITSRSAKLSLKPAQQFIRKITA